MSTRISKVASPFFALAMLFAFTAVLAAADSTAKPAEEKPACCRDAQGAGSAGAHCDRPAKSGDVKACCAEHDKKGGDANGCCDDCCHDSCDRPAGKGAPPKG